MSVHSLYISGAEYENFTLYIIIAVFSTLLIFSCLIIIILVVLFNRNAKDHRRSVGYYEIKFNLAIIFTYIKTMCYIEIYLRMKLLVLWAQCVLYA